MARKAGLRPVAELAAGVVRDEAIALAADNASLIDANYPVVKAIDCRGFDSIFVGAEIVGGTSPTLTVEALVRDAEAPDGSRWKRLLLGARDGITPIAAPVADTTPALGNNSDLAELRVFGHALVFLRVSAVANAAGTTAFKVIALPGSRSGR